MVSLLLTGGTVIDGSGRPRFGADVAIRGDRIAAIVRPGEGPIEHARRIDVSGRIVAPGFVDTDSHVDWALSGIDTARAVAPLLAQGVTTAIGGACGFSCAPVPEERRSAIESITAFLSEGRARPERSTFAQMLDAIERAPPPLNVGLLVGQCTVRAASVADLARPAREDERGRMVALVEEALEAGALGLAGNLGFAPGLFADDAELRAMLGPLRGRGIFTVHLRAYTAISDAYPPTSRAPHHVLAVREAIELARAAELRVQLGHLGVVGRRAWSTASRLLDEIDGAIERGVDVGFDVVPYPIGVGPLQMIFPRWLLRRLLARAGSSRRRDALLLRLMSPVQRRLLGLTPADIRLVRVCGDRELAAIEGLDFAAIGERLGSSAIEAQLEIARRTHLAAAVMIGAFSGDERDDRPLRALLAHSAAVVGTNAAVTEGGVANPAAHGAFPRVLGRFARELRLFSLEEAVRRMTSLPAGRFGLDGIGRVEPGCYADLVVFDPSTVSDSGWPARLDGAPIGIEHVLVSGRAAIERGVPTGSSIGRVIRRR